MELIKSKNDCYYLGVRINKPPYFVDIASGDYMINVDGGIYAGEPKLCTSVDIHKNTFQFENQFYLSELSGAKIYKIFASSNNSINLPLLPPILIATFKEGLYTKEQLKDSYEAGSKSGKEDIESLFDCNLSFSEWFNKQNY